MDLHPGGSFVTQMSENGGELMPHMNGCFLAVDDLQRIVFTNSLVGGWRPVEQPLIMTAIIRTESGQGSAWPRSRGSERG